MNFRLNHNYNKYLLISNKYLSFIKKFNYLPADQCSAFPLYANLFLLFLFELTTPHAAFKEIYKEYNRYYQGWDNEFASRNQ